MYVDSLTMWVDGIAQELSQAPVIVEDRTLVPLRAFDAVVTSIAWDAETQTVTVVP